MKQFMDAQSKKISVYFSDQDAKLIKLDDRLSVLEGQGTDQKFDIDKLQAATKLH